MATCIVCAAALALYITRSKPAAAARADAVRVEGIGHDVHHDVRGGLSKLQSDRQPGAASRSAAVPAAGGKSTRGPAGAPFDASNPERCASAVQHQGKRRRLKDNTVIARVHEEPGVVEARKGLVKLDCRGQWGNHLGQYAVARVIAEELNFGLQVCPRMLDDNWKKGHVFPNLLERAYNEESAKGLKKIEYGTHSYNVQTILEDPTPRVMHMWGYPFESFWPFAKFRSRIRSYFAINVGCLYWNQTFPGGNDVVVHVRSYADCKRNRGKENAGGGREKKKFDPTVSFVDPPYEYYSAILDRMKKDAGWDTLWLAARCGADDEVSARLMREYGAKLTPQPPVHGDMADFLFMAASKRLIMSQSTFSWWAAYIGDQTEVHYPLVGEWWGKRPRHRLYPDEPRYHFHDL